MIKKCNTQLNGKTYIWNGKHWYEKNTYLIPPLEIIQQLNKVLTSQNNNYNNWSNQDLIKQAQIFRDAFNTKEALKVIKIFLTRVPDNQGALAILCSILRRIGSPEQVLEETKDFVKNTSSEVIHTVRAAALCDLKKWKEAKVELSIAIRKRKSPEVFAVLNRIKVNCPEIFNDVKSRNAGLAIDMAEAAIKKQPRSKEVIKLRPELIPEIVEFLKQSGLADLETTYGVEFRLNNVNISLYRTGIISIKGEKSTEWYQKLLPECQFLLDKYDLEKNLIYPRIGIDESGKGDFFGPLVTAGFLIQSPEIERDLLELGVKDSKQINDDQILILAKKIEEMGSFEIIKINPTKYNQLYNKMSNINKILAWSHAKVIENLLSIHECQQAISNQFGDESLIKNVLLQNGKKIDLVQMPRAEQDLAVAAASILSRANFVETMQLLSRKLGVEIPFGTGNDVIDVGIHLIKEKKISSLQYYAKIHFATHNKIIENRELQ